MLFFFSSMGLDLLEGKVRNNLDAGVIEPAMSKVKIIQVRIELHIISSWPQGTACYTAVWAKLFTVVYQFATEAAITILRIDDMIRLVKDEGQNGEE